MPSALAMEIAEMLDSLTPRERYRVYEMVRRGGRALHELPIEGFRHAIRQTHDAESRLLCEERVVEMFESKRGWQGKVLVFELLNHPTAHLCYAWEVDGKVTSVLHESPVDSAPAAVRTAIVSDHDG